jgi:hypothetical protein
MKWQGEVLIDLMRQCAKQYGGDIYKWQDAQSYTQQCADMAYHMEKDGLTISYPDSYMGSIDSLESPLQEESSYTSEDGE